MPSERYYIDQEPLIEEQVYSFSGEEIHHMIHVMRTRIGSSFELVNGKGSLASAELLSYDKKSAQLLIKKVAQKPAPPPLILAVGLPRFNRLEPIIEKGTELNVTEFWLFPGMGSEKNSLSQNQQTRLGQLAIAAMKQCGRLDLPTIVEKPPLTQWAPYPGTIFFGDTREHGNQQTMSRSHAPCLFLIGPEKGFYPEEIAHIETRLNGVGVRLHGNILRVDTAAIVAAFLCSLEEEKT